MNGKHFCDTNVLVYAIERDLVHRFKVNYFDAQILAAAHFSGCEIVYSEDLNSGQDYAGIVVVNPFQDVKRGTTHGACHLTEPLRQRIIGGWCFEVLQAFRENWSWVIVGRPLSCVSPFWA